MEDPVAVFTGILATFTIVLSLVSIAQIYLLRLAQRDSAEATRATRAQYIRSHRPRLRVRHLVLGPNEVTNGKHVEGTFEVVNVGGTAARVVACHCQVFRAPILPLNRPYTGVHPAPPITLGTDIPAGAVATGSFKSTEPIPPDGYGIPGTATFVMGWIDYVDESQTTRRTAFCRAHRSGAEGQRFYPVESSDYEYED